MMVIGAINIDAVTLLTESAGHCYQA